MSSQYRVLCGVPGHLCTGGHLITDQQFPTNRAHSSHEDAFRCHVRWLISLGYKRVGQRELQPPDGGPIHLLQKKSRFGGLLVLGKEKRFMPERRRAGNRGVVY